MRENESHHFSSSSSSGGNVVVLAYSYAPLTTFWQGLLLDFQRERAMITARIHTFCLFRSTAAAVSSSHIYNPRAKQVASCSSAPLGSIPPSPSFDVMAFHVPNPLPFFSLFFLFVSPWAIQLSYDYLLKAFFFLSFSSSSSHPFLSGRIDWPVNKKNR